MKPVPATVAALTVTAAVPVEDRVNVCVVAVFAFTLPKDRLDVLTLSVGTAAPNCRAKVFATLSALAVRVAVCAVLTEEIVAVKLAVVEPAATVTEAGTVTDELLLARLTVNPPVAAAAFSVTVQLSVPAPVNRAARAAQPAEHRHARAAQADPGRSPARGVAGQGQRTGNGASRSGIELHRQRCRLIGIQGQGEGGSGDGEAGSGYGGRADGHSRGAGGGQSQRLRGGSVHVHVAEGQAGRADAERGHGSAK